MLVRQVRCPACDWSAVERTDALVSRLRLIGLLRRDGSPTDAFVEALLLDSCGRMTCPACKAIGLVIEPAPEEDEDDWDDWQAAILCEVCRKPIDLERVEALPGVRRCVACQGQAESPGGLPEEPDFCPRCGSLVELRVSRGGGLTRYRRFCTAGCRLS